MSDGMNEADQRGTYWEAVDRLRGLLNYRTKEDILEELQEDL